METHRKLRLPSSAPSRPCGRATREHPRSCNRCVRWTVATLCRSPPASGCRPPWSPEGRCASLRDGPSAHPSPDLLQPDRSRLWEAARSVWMGLARASWAMVGRSRGHRGPRVIAPRTTWNSPCPQARSRSHADRMTPRRTTAVELSVHRNRTAAGRDPRTAGSTAGRRGVCAALVDAHQPFRIDRAHPRPPPCTTDPVALGGTQRLYLSGRPGGHRSPRGGSP